MRCWLYLAALKRNAKKTCLYCKGIYPESRYSCPRCGTPSDVKNVSSWNRKLARKPAKLSLPKLAKKKQA